jgi:hypothetical protein
MTICYHHIRKRQKKFKSNKPLLEDDVSLDYTYVIETDPYDFDHYHSECDNVSRSFQYNHSIYGSSYNDQYDTLQRPRGHSILYSKDERLRRKMRRVKIKKPVARSVPIKDKGVGSKSKLLNQEPMRQEPMRQEPPRN